MATVEELEARLAQLEARLGPMPCAVAPITIGELADVPAPGSPIASQWAQEVSARIIHRFGSTAARATAFPAPVKGTASYLGTSTFTEGLELFNGVSWRKPWNMPFGSLGSALRNTDAPGLGTTPTDILTLPLSGLIANRQLRLSAYLMVTTSATGSVLVTLTDAANVVLQQCNVPANAGASAQGLYLTCLVTSPAGTATWKLRVASSAATVGVLGSNTYPVTLTMEDIGPGGAAPS